MGFGGVRLPLRGVSVGLSSKAVVGFVAAMCAVVSGCTATGSDDPNGPVAIVVSDSELTSEELDPLAVTDAPADTPTDSDPTDSPSTTAATTTASTTTTTIPTTTSGLRVLDIEYSVDGDVVSGQVVENGEPVSNVDIRLQDPDSGETFQVRGTDLDGRYKFGPLEPACYKTKAVAPNNARWVERYNSPRYAYDYMCVE